MLSSYHTRVSVFLLVSLLFVSGCSAKKTVLLTQMRMSAEPYHAIELLDFGRTKDAWVPYDSATIIPDMVAEELKAKAIFPIVTRSRAWTDSYHDGTLIVDGTVIGYDPGCKFCEWLIGINDNGKSSIAVRVKFIDGASGDIIADVEIKGRATRTGTGRDRYVRVVNEIVSLAEKISHKG